MSNHLTEQRAGCYLSGRQSATPRFCSSVSASASEEDGNRTTLFLLVDFFNHLFSVPPSCCLSVRLSCFLFQLCHVRGEECAQNRRRSSANDDLSSTCTQENFFFISTSAIDRLPLSSAYFHQFGQPGYREF